MNFRDMWDRATDDVNCAARRDIGYDPVEAFRLGIINFIREFAVHADTFAGMAGVGGVETAGSLISYLAAPATHRPSAPIRSGAALPS